MGWSQAPPDAKRLTVTSRTAHPDPGMHAAARHAAPPLYASASHSNNNENTCRI